MMLLLRVTACLLLAGAASWAQEATPAPTPAPESAQSPAPEATPTPTPESQAPAPEATPTPAPDDTDEIETTPPPSEGYRVGAGDVLDVLVFGNADLSRSAGVQPNGTLFLPLLGEVPVAGLTTSEIQRKLTTLLARDYLVNPHVEVKVKEYQSQFVFVVGEVNQPGRKPLRGHTRLIDSLIDAGGFSASASGEIVITRPDGFGDGAQTLTVRLGSANPTMQDYINAQIPLRNGDILSASRTQYVTVEGEVARPNRYPIGDELTLTGVISQAGGLTRFGSTKVRVRRVNPRTADIEILEINLKDVRDGKEPDLPLEPNDVVSVSRRLF